MVLLYISCLPLIYREDCGHSSELVKMQGKTDLRSTDNLGLVSTPKR